MHDCLGHYVRNRTAHQIVVMRDHLAAREGKGAKEIEFGDKSQNLTVLHHRKRIEVVCSNSAPSWPIVVCRSNVMTVGVMN
jgi:hypothetical protein